MTLAVIVVAHDQGCLPLNGRITDATDEAEPHGIDEPNAPPLRRLALRR
jgi:hypothetical protein